MKRHGFLTLVAALALALPAQANNIGVMGAVNPALEGTPPAEQTRVLVTGDAIFQNEEIVSGPDGLGYAMFADQTALTIAPNSRIVLDRYVYDPDTDTGEIALTLARGAVRFIGGRITKSADAVINAPTSTIGIRGGMAVVSADPTTEEVLFLAGDYASVSTGGAPLFVSRPGGLVTVDVAAGAVPVFAGLAGPDKIAATSGAFGTPGNGGAGAPGQGAAASGVTAANSLAPGGATRGPVSTTGLFTESAFAEENVLNVTAVQDAANNAFFTDPTNFDDLLDDMDFIDVGGSGEIRGQLVWRDSSDLDLHLILPDGAGEVAFFNPTIVFNEGGATATLDADNLGGVVNVEPDLRVENIVVTGEDIPAGTYVFFADGFSINNPDGTNFELTATGDGGATSRRITGRLTTSGQDSDELIIRREENGGT